MFAAPLRRDPHAFKKELQPRLPVTCFAHLAQEPEVGVAVSIEMETHVEERLPQHAGVEEHEGDEYSSHPAVSVQERVDRLELQVGQGDSDQRRHPVVAGVEEEFQVSHAPVHGASRRGYEGRVARPGAADPVLRAAEVARVLVPSASARHQHTVDLPDQAVRQWKPPIEPAEPVSERGDVVRRLDDVVERSAGRFPDLQQQKVGQRRPDALDPGREHRLLADAVVREERPVGQQGRHAVQAAQADRGILQGRGERAVQRERRAGRKRLRHEGAHPFTAGHGDVVSSRRSSVHVWVGRFGLVRKGE